MRRILWALVLLSSCATVDMEKRVRTGAGTSRERNEPVVITVPVETTPEPRIIEIERPVYTPPVGAAPPSRETGRTAVQQSNRAGILEPAEYSRAAMIYDYHADWVYEIYTQPLRASDIRLEPGEQALEAPFISDSARWMLGAGVSREAGLPVQHIYVKPTEISIEASLIINTDKRVYHIILKSFRDVHMPMVRWRYPETGMPHNFISSPETRTPGAAADAAMEIAGIDPRFLSFNYRIGYRLGRKPKWLPVLVYDDARKTYITFPEQVLQLELPAVFENRNDIINYRVVENLIIIDKLIEKITVKIEKISIIIEKKKR
ncbi:MAG: TrbG/VirB9 family P-type conjugative transfer protein [Treponema sp.]|jgi:type IV secretion system protein VirB9|nr:TrbG/VirB9 family P-type conjugative transfer protein [Treponema sp.]